MSSSITVEAKVFGRRRPVIADWSVPLPIHDPEECLTLRQLIICIVQAEVEAFKARQDAQQLQQVLSAAQVDLGVAQGKVTMGDRNLEQQVNLETAIDNAILGFIDGLYYVFLDDVQQEELDAEVELQPNSQLTFLRLVALVGG